MCPKFGANWSKTVDLHIMRCLDIIPPIISVLVYYIILSTYIHSWDLRKLIKVINRDQVQLIKLNFLQLKVKI